ELDRRMAAVADQERHRMLRGARVVAGDERVDRLELVDEAVGEQEIQRAIDGGRRRSPGALGIGGVADTELLEQVVGLDRLAGLGDEAQHPRPDRRQAQAAGAAGGLHRVDERVGIVDVVVGIGAGVLLGHGPMMGARCIARKARSYAGSIPSAASMRASASSLPARYTVWAMSGLTWVPVMATRNGCATLPMPSSRASAVACSAAPMSSTCHRASAASRSRASANGARASALKCLATAFSSYSASGRYQTAARSAMSLSVCTRSRNASTTSAGAGPRARSKPAWRRCHSRCPATASGGSPFRYCWLSQPSLAGSRREALALTSLRSNSDCISAMLKISWSPCDQPSRT